jgi:hypothetical protein
MFDTEFDAERKRDENGRFLPGYGCYLCKCDSFNRVEDDGCDCGHSFYNHKESSHQELDDWLIVE